VGGNDPNDTGVIYASSSNNRLYYKSSTGTSYDLAAGVYTPVSHNHQSAGVEGGTLSAASAIGSGLLPVVRGGTGQGTFADKAVLTTQTASPNSGDELALSTVMDANGELLIGGTSGPVAATLTAGSSNITITNTNGGIAIDATGIGGTVNSGTAYRFPFYMADGTVIGDTIQIGNVTSTSPITWIPGSTGQPTKLTLGATFVYLNASLEIGASGYFNAVDIGSASGWFQDIYAEDFHMSRDVSGNNRSVALTASATLAASYTLTFPAAAPAANQVLMTPSSSPFGTLEWGTFGGTVNSGTAYKFPFYMANGTTIGDTITLNTVVNDSPISMVSPITVPSAI